MKGLDITEVNSNIVFNRHMPKSHRSLRVLDKVTQKEVCKRTRPLKGIIVGSLFGSSCWALLIYCALSIIN